MTGYNANRPLWEQVPDRPTDPPELSRNAQLANQIYTDLAASQKELDDIGTEYDDVVQAFKYWRHLSFDLKEQVFNAYKTRLDNLNNEILRLKDTLGDMGYVA